MIKTAAQILKGRPRPVDQPRPTGRPLKYGTRSCKIDGCPVVHWGHGYCRPHGRRFLLYGDPLWVKGQPRTCICDRCPIHHPDNVAFRK